MGATGGTPVETLGGTPKPLLRFVKLWLLPGSYNGQ